METVQSVNGITLAKMEELKNLPDLLTKQELAKLMGVTTMTIYNYTRKYGLPYLQFSPVIIRFNPSQVYDWWIEQTKSLRKGDPK